ncbi:aminopeptidase N C-terminal domain-containing protein, partial [Salmonella enterica]|uniref:aminopeptidase N C-terminal domain-containing protein n=1 Tax=Salmonella enterica TaxID=28901 RepID=UPI00398C5A21
VEALRAVVADTSLDPAFREQMLILPAESYLAERMDVADPAAIHTARRTLRRTLAEQLNAELLRAYQDNQTEGAYSPDAVSAGKRALKNIALGYVVETEAPEALALAARAGMPLAVMAYVLPHACRPSCLSEIRSQHVVDRVYHPRSAVAICVKDFGRVADRAERQRLPVACP